MTGHNVANTETRDKIISKCAAKFAANSADCNRFLKAVAADFYEPDLFTGANMDADRIIAWLERPANGWADLEKSHSDAISDARAGKFVIAGMTSSELSDDHGHLAIVVGDPGELSGTVTVPICYAGSLNSTARVQRKRVSETFGAQVARDGEIRYYSKAVGVVPGLSALDILLNAIDERG